MNDYDFSRSFLRWTSTHNRHTPRLEITAACRVTHAGRETDFFLSAFCVGEAMYAESRLIHTPPYDFAMIAATDGRYYMLKFAADPTRNHGEIHHVGDTMSTYDGRGATIREMSVMMARHARMRPLTTYDEVRAAILDHAVVNARTTLDWPDGQTRVVADYPVRVCNVANGRPRWQVDAGMVLLPDQAADPFDIASLRMGYLVFNAWDWAEVCLRVPAPEEPPPSLYDEPRRLAARNELFAAG